MPEDKNVQSENISKIFNKCWPGNFHFFMFWVFEILCKLQQELTIWSSVKNNWITFSSVAFSAQDYQRSHPHPKYVQPETGRSKNQLKHPPAASVLWTLQCIVSQGRNMDASSTYPAIWKCSREPGWHSTSLTKPGLPRQNIAIVWPASEKMHEVKQTNKIPTIVLPQGKMRRKSFVTVKAPRFEVGGLSKEREGWSRCKSPLKAQWDSYAWVQMGLCMDKMFGQWEFMRARRTWTPVALHRLTAPLASFCSEAFGWVNSFNSFRNAFIPTAVAGIAEMKVWFQGIPRIAGLGEKLKGKSNDGIAAEKNLSWRCDRKESCGGWTSRWVGSVGMKATITEIKWKWKWTLWWKVKVGKWMSRSTGEQWAWGWNNPLKRGQRRPLWNWVRILLWLVTWGHRG